LHSFNTFAAETNVGCKSSFKHLANYNNCKKSVKLYKNRTMCVNCLCICICSWQKRTILDMSLVGSTLSGHVANDWRWDKRCSSRSGYCGDGVRKLTGGSHAGIGWYIALYTQQQRANVYPQLTGNIDHYFYTPLLSAIYRSAVKHHFNH